MAGAAAGEGDGLGDGVAGGRPARKPKPPPGAGGDEEATTASSEADEEEAEEAAEIDAVLSQLRSVLSVSEETGVRLARAPLFSPLDVEGVAGLIAGGRARRVICMVGAGISVNAGIPDFRSPGAPPHPHPTPAAAAAARWQAPTPAKLQVVAPSPPSMF